MSDKKYWNDSYYSNLKDSQKDFAKEAWLEKYKDLVITVENKKAIDLGCGLGQDSVWLRKNGFDVVACDFSQKALDKLKETYLNIKTMNLDFTKDLPFKSNTIGIVNANLSVHYYNNDTTHKIFNNIYDILEEGGLFVGRVNSDKNDYVNENYVKIEEDFYYDKSKSMHKRLFNKKQFDLLIKKWNVIVLKEDETIRKGRKKYTWEFILRK